MASENRRNTADDLDFDSDNDEFLKSYTRKLLQKSMQPVEFTDEDELISLTTSQTMIVHFYNPAFRACSYMNKALRLVAPKFPSIKFVLIEASKCPRMSDSLCIDILPFVGFFRDGFFVDQLVGFEKLGNRPTFLVEDLEKFIRESNIFRGNNE